MFEQLKQKYVSSFDEKKTHLKQALATQDSQALTALVHQLAGSSGSYGFDEISECCQEIEEMLHENEQLTQKVSQKTTQLIHLMSN